MILFIKHVENEGPGLLMPFFEGKGYSAVTVELWAGEKLPDSLAGIRAVISMGGPMNVYEEGKYPFLKEEDIFIKEILKAEIPFLGVCLGAQLLAKASGASVGKSPVEETGFHDVSLTDDGRKDPLFRGVEGTFKVFQWHGDMFQIPPDGRLLAENVNCGNQALRVGENAYGLQFHVEAGREMVIDWMKGKYGKDAAGFRSFRKLAEANIGGVLQTGDKIFENFAGLLG